MSGSLLPWWGWLLIAQAIFVYALFEYVRRITQSPHTEVGPPLSIAQEELARLQSTASQQAISISRLEEQVEAIGHTQTSERAVVGNLGGAIEQIMERLDKLEARFDATLSLNSDDSAQRFRALYLALAAIWHRERLKQLEVALKEEGEWLSLPVTEKRFHDENEWDRWQGREENWRCDLDRWCELAEVYKRGVSRSIVATPEHLYKAKWSITDDQFPNANAVWQFKTFRIILRNWDTALADVQRRVHLAAFGGQAAQIVAGEDA